MSQPLPVRVRPATRLDEVGVLDVLRADGEVRGQQLSKVRLLRVRDKLRSPTALTLLAESDVQAVGVVHAELAREQDGNGAVVPGLLHLSLLCVVPAHRRRGVGQSLLTGLLERFPHVSTWAPDEVSAAALRAVGFVPTGRSAVVRGACAEQLVKQAR